MLRLQNVIEMQTQITLSVRPDAAALLTRLGSFFRSVGIEPYLVGGYVRDTFIGRPSHDIDLTVGVNAPVIAREMADALQGTFVLLDEVHQVARVVVPMSGERWNVDLATLRGTIEEDLAKRDFTIDAIAVRMTALQPGPNPVDSIDPLNGVPDIEQKLIRAASDTIFQDDPARLLRAFRLAAELGFSIAPETEALVQRDALLVPLISGERVHDELGRILETDRTGPVLRHLDRLGLLGLLVPELMASKGVTQPPEHYWDVFDHSIETVIAAERLWADLVAGGVPWAPFKFAEAVKAHLGEAVGGGGLTRKGLLKLAALLHDIAKPETRTVEPTGRIRFLGHAQRGARMAESILDRFRFSSREKKLVTGIIEHHLRPGYLSNAPEPPTHRAIYRYFRDTADAAIAVLFLSLADHLATRGPAFNEKAWRTHLEVTEYMLGQWLAREKTVSPPKLVNGHRLMKEFGLEPGPRIGHLLESVREAQAAGEIETEAEALDFVRKELRTNHGAQG